MQKEWIREVHTHLPLFIIWGVVWILQAGLDILEEWGHLPWVKEVILLLAAVASIGVIWRGRLKSGRSSSLTTDKLQDRASLLLPGIMVVAAVLLLEWMGAVGPFFIPVFRAMVLAIGYVLLGSLLGRPLIYLGMWLFALSAITGVWYLGYAYVVLEGMGGISLLLCAWMLRTWSRAHT
jgi:hypothetical protein